MAKNSRLELIAAGMLLACSSFSVRAQQLPTTAPTGAIDAEGTAAALVPPPDRHLNTPHVSCPGDQLTIKADNSLLSSVLDAVHACIGVKIALPEGAVDGPVFFELGPGRTRDVLDSLLNASDVDFVILLSPTAPRRSPPSNSQYRTTGLGGGNAQGVTTNGPMTPARLAWLAARNLGRGAPPAQRLSSLLSTDTRGVRQRVCGCEYVKQFEHARRINSASSNRDADTTTTGTPTAVACADEFNMGRLLPMMSYSTKDH